jgi:hypothetical protein
MSCVDPEISTFGSGSSAAALEAREAPTKISVEDLTRHARRRLVSLLTDDPGQPTGVVVCSGWKAGARRTYPRVGRLVCGSTSATLGQPPPSQQPSIF